jgi:hypothetical protein
MNRPVLIFSGHSKYCELLLPDVKRCEVDFQQLCIDSAIIRKKCRSWGIRYVPSILEFSSQGLIVYEGYDQCYAYMQAYMPEPEPEPLPKRNPPHRYEMAVPKVKHVDRERSSRMEPHSVQKPEVPMDPDQELLDLRASSGVSSLSELLGNLEEDADKKEETTKSRTLRKETIAQQLERKSAMEEKELNPHLIQERKIQTYNEDKEQRAAKLEKKARDIAKKNDEEDLVSLAKKMQKARESMDTKTRQSDKIPEGQINRSHSLPTMRKKTKR